MTSPEPARRFERPRSPWLQLCPPGTMEIDIRSGPVETHQLSAELPVVLMDQRPLSRRRLRRVARDLGVVLEREFVVLPTIGRPMVVIDDVETAVRHFWTAVATVPPGLAFTAVPASALLGLARRAPWRWTGAIAPGRVVIGRRTMTEAPKAFHPHPRSVHDLLFAPGSRGVLIATSRDPDAKRTFIVAPPVGTYVDGPAGEVAIKIPVTMAAATAIDRETRMLVALGEADLGGLGNTIPRYLETLDSDGLPAVVTSVVRGTPMSVAYHRWLHTSRQHPVTADFALAGGWLRHFQSATAGDRSRITWATEVSRYLRDRWSPHPRLEAAQVRLGAADRQLKSHRVAKTMVHGDYWFGNLLVDDGRISGVVDWESGVRAGWPLRDLVRFALSYCLYLDRHTRPGHQVRGHRGLRRAGFGAGIRYGLLDEGWLPDLVRLYLRTGVDALGLPSAVWYGAALVGLGEIAATANDDEFARNHLELLADLPHWPLADDLPRS